ncbi:MAG TPA: ThuA domain-containing protein [Pirellulales bacterium]|jgi:hypothetical protein
MKRRDLLLLTAAAICLTTFPLRMATGEAAADKPKRKVLFFTKSSGFQHSAITRGPNGELGPAEKALTKLGEQNGFEVECTKDGRVFDKDLNQYDAIFFYTTEDLTKEGGDKNPPMSAAGKQKLFDYVASGKGFLASHSGADTFHSPGHHDGKARETQKEVDPYIAMLGGEFISHGPQQVARQVIVDPKFPGFGEAADEGTPEAFKINDEWYSLKNFADDLHVILVMDTQGMNGKDYQRPPFPSTWARRHGKGRVFYTSMGHREDVWENPKFQKMLLGGLSWAFGDAEAPTPANIKQATPGAGVMPPK